MSSSSSSSRSSSPDMLPVYNEITHHAMTDAELEALPTSSSVGEKQDCAICYAELNEGKVKVRMLPCKHVFHELCIFPWLRMQPSCPICRHKLKEASSYVAQDQVELWRMLAMSQEEVDLGNILPGSELSSGPARNTRSRIRQRTRPSQ